MKFSAGFTVCFAALAAAGPIDRKKITDGEILNYALTLEHLENAFYAKGRKVFTAQDFYDAGYTETFYKNLLTIGNDEQAHVDFLEAGLKAAGAKATKPCEYKFPTSSVTEFVMVSSVLEGVGVSAYLGAAASIMEKAYLTAAGSILTIEARHSSYIRSAMNQTPFPQPFDTPLTFNEVYSLATQFIVSCPSDNPPLPFKAFPRLTLDFVNQNGPIIEGSEVTLKLEEGSEDKRWHEVYAAFITVTGPIIVDAHMEEGAFKVFVPKGVNGQTYVVLINSKDTVSDETIVAGPAVLEVANY